MNECPYLLSCQYVNYVCVKYTFPSVPSLTGMLFFIVIFGDNVNFHCVHMEYFISVIPQDIGVDSVAQLSQSPNGQDPTKLSFAFWG